MQRVGLVIPAGSPLQAGTFYGDMHDPREIFAPTARGRIISRFTVKKNEVAGQPGVDPTLPKATFLAKGMAYHPVFDFNAIVQVQVETGFNLMAAGVEMFSNPLICRAILWASLLPSHPSMTLEQAGKLISHGNYLLVIEALKQAWTESLPEEDKEGNASAE